jgi:Tol biopolymer transport system component
MVTVATAVLTPWLVGMAVAPVDPNTRNSGPPAVPARIVFTSDDGLWSIDPDGSDLAQLTHHQNDISPAWVPGREAIAFVHAMTTSKGIGQLRLIDSDGSHARVVVRRWPGGEPTWSPDTDRVAY